MSTPRPDRTATSSLRSRARHTARIALALSAALCVACGAHPRVRAGSVGLSCRVLPQVLVPGIPGSTLRPDCAHPRRVVLGPLRLPVMAFTHAYLVLPDGSEVALPASEVPALLTGRLYVGLAETVHGGTVRFGHAQAGDEVPFTLEGESAE